jgi:DNA-binding response OmpR family regulator
MSQEMSPSKEILKNIQILIIEDDLYLSTQLSNLFSNVCVNKPILAHSIEQGRYEYKSMRDVNRLVIMDLMLPDTEKTYKDIQKLEMELDSIRKTIEQSGTQPLGINGKNKIYDARFKRAKILREIQSLIIREGGIVLAKEIRLVDNRTPILFLTAVGADEIVEKGTSIAGELSEWLVKPVPSKKIFEKAISLILKRDSF